MLVVVVRQALVRAQCLVLHLQVLVLLHLPQVVPLSGTQAEIVGVRVGTKVAPVLLFVDRVMHAAEGAGAGIRQSVGELLRSEQATMNVLLLWVVPGLHHLLQVLVQVQVHLLEAVAPSQQRQATTFAKATPTFSRLAQLNTASGSRTPGQDPFASCKAGRT